MAEDNAGIKRCETLEESVDDCGESSCGSISSEESYSSEEVESSSDASSTASSSRSSSASSDSKRSDRRISDKSSSSTEAKNSLLEKKASCRNSLNYQLPEVVPVLVTPEEKVRNRGGCGGNEQALPNEQTNKLSSEEKKRIRKLREKLAASAAVSPDKETTSLVHDKDNKDSEKPHQHRHHHHRHHHHHYHSQKHFKERKPKKNFAGYKMFGKLSCVSCVDTLRECCGVANDEPTNGVKILRRKDPPVDLHTDLPTLSNISVVQRLKLILEKLESGQLDTVPPEILQKNIQYAIQLIQDGDPLKDRVAPSQHGPPTIPASTASPSTDESALRKLSHNIRHHQHQQLVQQHQLLQKRQSSTTSCVASSTAASFITAATDASATTTTTTTFSSASTNPNMTIDAITTDSSPQFTHLPQIKNLSSSAIPTTETPSATSSPDLPNVTIVPESNTVVVAVTSATNNDNHTTVTSTSSSSTRETPPTPTTAPLPTIITPKTERKSSIAGGGANDTLTVPESRRRDESDNELSEVDEEVIPEEVRKWLASTFTKTVQPKPRLEPRPRFRSVANAIRVGLFVDRFYRQLSATTLEIPADIQQYLKEVNNWHFDIFRLHDKSSGHSLKYVAKELFSRYGIVSRFRLNLDKLESFLSAVEYGYTKLKNPYHNDIHAADVTQTLHYFIGSTGLANMFTDLEIFSLLFAALIHDFEHTGRTNNFHVNVGTELALLYNDRSVLENHHVSAAFRLLRDEDKSILTNLKPEEFRDFRNLVIEMVLSTDMSTHFAQIKNVRAILNGEKVSSTTTMSLMSLLLHTADISHPGKPWRMHKKFADTILEEFFLQGDEEAKLGLPFSPLCDRNNVLIPESQISFIEFIVEPSLTIMTDLIDFVLNVDDHSGPMQLSNSAPVKTDSSDPKKSATNSGNSENAVNNKSNSSSGNDASSNTPGSDSSSASATNNSDTKSASTSTNSPSKSNSSTTVAPSRVPPPVPSRQGKSQIKPFQNLSPSSGGGSTGTSGRRTESENCIKTAAFSSSNNTSDASGKIPLSSRTPSFPLQSGSNHNYGPVLRPWINHLVENKAKWRMISAESAAAAGNATQEANS